MVGGGGGGGGGGAGKSNGSCGTCSLYPKETNFLQNMSNRQADEMELN